MPVNSQTAKILVGTVVLLLGAGGVHRWARVSRAQMASSFHLLEVPLSEVPLQLGPYVFRRDVPLDSEVLRVAQVDSFVNRDYVDAISGQPIEVYVGYWGRQSVGMGHGPEVCFPAAGWQSEGEALQHVVRLPGPGGAEKEVTIVLHHFVRTKQERVERVAVGFVAIADSQFRTFSRGLFAHLAPRPDTGFLAHISVVAPVPYSRGDSADSRVVAFMELLLPHVSRCLFGIPERVDALEVAKTVGGDE